MPSPDDPTSPPISPSAQTPGRFQQPTAAARPSVARLAVGCDPTHSTASHGGQPCSKASAGASIRSPAPPISPPHSSHAPSLVARAPCATTRSDPGARHPCRTPAFPSRRCVPWRCPPIRVGHPRSPRSAVLPGSQRRCPAASRAPWQSAVLRGGRLRCDPLNPSQKTHRKKPINPPTNNRLATSVSIT